MFVAPLNYDRFFKKVFSDLNIAKCFLEDFFDKTIETIEMLPPRHRLTDEAMVVEFDYRCKIDGNYVVIDMQQWYKTGLAKRFYVYHCLNSALQLEHLPIKKIGIKADKKNESKDYSLLEPTITLIWMAEDTFGSDENLLSFVLLPDFISDMLQNDVLWETGTPEVLKSERQRAIKALNQTRQLSFLRENKLIYAFQKNIVRDQKYHRYIRWFRFAEKSRNKDNKQEDFKEFLNDKIFMEVINRLDKRSLLQEDFQYIDDYDDLHEKFIIAKESWIKEMRPELEEKIRPELEEKIRPELEEKMRPELEEKIKIENAEKFLKKGMGISEVSFFSELTIEQVQEIADRLNLHH